MIAQKDIDLAYMAQKKFVAEKIKTRGIGGYKAAASSFAAQQNLGLSKPMVGVLYANGALENGATLKLSDFHLAKIETEVGFRLAKDITQKMNETEVKEWVSSVVPVFEIPDMTLDASTQVSPIDMIANNTVSSHYLIGEEIPVHSVDPNKIRAQLYLNGTSISVGKASDAMGNQWLALSEAINLTIEHGYLPKKGDLVITGALGDILNIEKGTYTADYGKLGCLKLIAK